MFEYDHEVEPDQAKLKALMPDGFAEQMVLRSDKRLAASSIFPQWSPADVTIKNTFISVAFDHDDNEDEEMMMLKAARRRDVQSCPHLDASDKHEVREAKSHLVCSTELKLDSFPEQSHESTEWALATPTSDDGLQTMPEFLACESGQHIINDYIPNGDFAAYSIPMCTALPWDVICHEIVAQYDVPSTLAVPPVGSVDEASTQPHRNQQSNCFLSPEHNNQSSDSLASLLNPPEHNQSSAYLDTLTSMLNPTPTESAKRGLIPERATVSDVLPESTRAIVCTAIPNTASSSPHQRLRTRRVRFADPPMPETTFTHRAMADPHVSVFSPDPATPEPTCSHSSPLAGTPLGGTWAIITARRDKACLVREALQQHSSSREPIVPGFALDVSRPDMIAALPNMQGARRSRRGGSRHSRLWCHIYLDPAMLERGFDLVPKIIGKSGCNTMEIFTTTQTKVRVRGRGSGHKEKHNGREAPVPLMIALAAEGGSDFKTAFGMTKQLLADVSQRFESFLQNQKASRLQWIPEQRRFWVGDISEESLSSLGELADGMM